MIREHHTRTHAVIVKQMIIHVREMLYCLYIPPVPFECERTWTIIRGAETGVGGGGGLNY